jgi:UDP-N-acetylglucosamine--N-acetylmuramyl-(pentapeptide) pyrophosphoryl-undecaprenol N-acetylglucosamine transferase
MVYNTELFNFNNHHNALAIAIVAGKSGGHIIPGVALAQRYQREHNAAITFFTASTPLDYTIMREHNTMHHVPLSAASLPRAWYHVPWWLFQCVRSVVISYRQLRACNSTLLISTGGFVSLPVALAAWMARIPIDVYEVNAEPGKTVRALSCIARTIYSPFASNARFFSKKKFKVCDYPLRFTQSERLSRAEACEQFGFSENKKVIVVMGGSQGSIFLNTLILRWLSHNHTLHDSLQIIHQIGSRDTDHYAQQYAAWHMPHIVFAYCHDVLAVYAIADVIIGRAGAGSLFEAAYFRKKNIVIPLITKTTAHQKINAYEMQKMHPALIQVIDQSMLIHDIHAFDRVMKEWLL